MNSVDIIFHLIEEHHMTAAQLTREAGLTNGLLSQWKKGSQKPSSKNLQKIADYFHVSVDYLLTGEGPQKKSPDPKPEDDVDISNISFAFSGEVADLTDDEKEDLLAVVRLMRQRRKSREEAKKKEADNGGQN